jgi:uncharacterized protein YndB with AHSA1/START domain
VKADRARVTTHVEVDALDAFQVFTEEIDRWWRRGPKFRNSRRFDGRLEFEGGEGGRLVERSGDEEVFEIGRVLVWQPGARLVFEWRGSNFGPKDVTEVEVSFEPTASGTRVVLEHRGWEKLPLDHPVRHGLDGSAFTSMIGLWWGDLLTSYRMSSRA